MALFLWSFVYACGNLYMNQNACGESHTAANGVFGKIRPTWKNIGKNNL